MRTMLSRAGSPDEAGLHISRACEYAWATLPYLERDPRHPEDMRTDGPDHGADALRMGLLWQPPLAITEQRIPNFWG